MLTGELSYETYWCPETRRVIRKAIQCPIETWPRHPHERPAPGPSSAVPHSEREGDILVSKGRELSSFNRLPCAWVTDKGRWLGVMYGDHYTALRRFSDFRSYGEAEAAGWIHVGGQHESDCPRHDGKRYTPAQRRKLEQFGYFPED